MIEKRAVSRIREPSEFLDLNRAGKAMIPVSFLIPTFAHRQASDSGEHRNRNTGTLRAVD